MLTSPDSRLCVLGETYKNTPKKMQNSNINTHQTYMGGQHNLENIIKASHGYHTDTIHINKVLQAFIYFNLMFNRQLVPNTKQEGYDLISAFTVLCNIIAVFVTFVMKIP